MTTTEKLPDELAKPLDELLVALKPQVPERLRALVLYGGVAKGKALSESSDLNLLIVLADGSTATLDAVAGPLERARQRGRVAPLIVAEG